AVVVGIWIATRFVAHKGSFDRANLVIGSVMAGCGVLFAFLGLRLVATRLNRRGPFGQDALADSYRRRVVRLLTFRGIEFRFHGSLLTGGILATALGGFDAGSLVYYCLAYFLLVFVHEMGHAAAAAALRLKIHALDFYGAGGLCWMESPRRVRDSVIVYSAGIAAEALLLLATLVYAAVAGKPTSLFGHSVYF